jgi:hypothetical protein
VINLQSSDAQSRYAVGHNRALPRDKLFRPTAHNSGKLLLGSPRRCGRRCGRASSFSQPLAITFLAMTAASSLNRRSGRVFSDSSHVSHHIAQQLAGCPTDLSSPRHRRSEEQIAPRVRSICEAIAREQT